MTPTKNRYRYELEVDIPATEVAVLVDALDGERFTLREKLGRDELRRQLDEQRLHIQVTTDEAWPEFQQIIETLSVYLSEPISGREIHLEASAGGPVLAGFVITARRGISERTPLHDVLPSDLGIHPP